MNQSKLPLILKPEDWPALDRQLWSKQFEASALFDEDGNLAHWCAPTRQAGFERYGQWLSFIARRKPELFEAAPNQRLSRKTVGDYIGDCENRGLSVATIFGLVQVLSSTCEAMGTEQDWTWLKTAAARYRSKVRQLGLKPAIPISAGEILDWSINRLSVVEAMPEESPIIRALYYRDALMVGCLIACPVRSRAFSSITVDQHLFRGKDRFGFRFFAEDMKDKKARNFSLHKCLAAPLIKYLALHRKTLLRGRLSEMMWIGRSGRPLSKDGLAHHLKDVTRKHLGIPLGPHKFRQIAATSIAEFDPEHVGIIRDILGHETLDMAEKHYNRASMKAANTRLQQVLKQIVI